MAKKVWPLPATVPENRGADPWIQDYRDIGEKSRFFRYQYVISYFWIDVWHFARSATVEQNRILSLLAAGFPAGKELKPDRNGGRTASHSQSSAQEPHRRKRLCKIIISQNLTKYVFVSNIFYKTANLSSHGEMSQKNKTHMATADFCLTHM